MNDVRRPLSVGFFEVTGLRRVRVAAAALAAVVLVTRAASVGAQPCPLGISAETAQRVFDETKAIAVAGDYTFEGVSTEGSSLSVRWSYRGESCPPIRIGVVNCRDRFRRPALDVDATAAVTERCPGLRPVLEDLSRLAAGEAVVGEPPYLLPRSAMSGRNVGLFLAFIGIGSLAMRYRQVLGASISAAISVLAWPLKQVPGGRPARVVVTCLLVCLLAEGAYRAALVVERRRTVVSAPHFDIYGVGESTMVGEPFDPLISVPRLLEYMFGGQIDERRIVVDNLAERGVPLYPQAVLFGHTVIGRDPETPGVVLVISGHNERIVPGDDEGPSWLTVAGEHSFLLGDAVMALRRRRMIGREQSLAMYEYYLRQVVERARRAGLVPVLTTMASNVSGVEPNYLGTYDDGCRTIVEAGAQLEAQRQYARAWDSYRDALAQARCPVAVLRYLMARCDVALEDFVAARDAYWDAVDADPRTAFGRTTRAQNDVIRRVALEYDVPLVDAAQLFEQHSPHGIPGNDLFMDGQHPTLAGYLLLANAYARVLQDRFGAHVTRPLGEPEEAARALGLDRDGWSAAMVDAGSWLITTSVGHPFPRDRMTLAAARFRSVVDDGDQFSGWVGLGLAQAAVRGLLFSQEDVSAIRSWLGFKRSYSPAPDDLSSLLTCLDRFGVDGDVIAHIRASAQAVADRATDRPGSR